MAKGNALVRVLPKQSGVSLEFKTGKARTWRATGPLLHLIETDSRETSHADARMSVYPTYVVYRCNRWGTYRKWLIDSLTMSDRPRRVQSWWGPVVLYGRVRQDWRDPRDACPVDIPEALETQRCVDTLPVHLRVVITHEHVMRGTQEEKARMIQISRTTFWRHLQIAYPMLLDRFLEAAAGIDSVQQ